MPPIGYIYNVRTTPQQQGGEKMAVTSKEERLKFRLKYDKGSQTFNQCNPAADDENIYRVANAISELRKDEEVEITKITETDLIEE